MKVQCEAHIVRDAAGRRFEVYVDIGAAFGTKGRFMILTELRDDKIRENPKFEKAFRAELKKQGGK